MKVTANILLNYIRCRRYASLNDPTSDGDSVLNNISSERYYDEFKDVFQSLYLDDIQQLKHDQTITYDFHPEIELHEVYDFFYTKDGIRHIYTLVPSTSKDFLKRRFNLNKRKYQLFKQDSEGIFRCKPAPKVKGTTNYQDKIDKLTSRTNDLGRIVYREAFKRFIYDKVFEDPNAQFYLVLLNTDYRYDGIKYDSDMFHILDLSTLYPEMSQTIEADIYRMINHIELNDFTACPLVKKECRKDDTFECKFTSFCFSHLPKDSSILNYFNSHRGFYEPTDRGEIHHDTYDLINRGYVLMQDIPIAWLKDEKHLMQRYCVETDYVHVHKEKINALLDTLVYPLIYLDFEALPCLLPRYRGETPFTQSVFQYSIHIQQKPGVLEKNGNDHYEYIANPEYDNRKELVRSMIHIINRYDSSVVVYHKTFEEQRLKEMQEYFPEYKQDLQRIIDRLFDLKDVLKNNKKFYIRHGFSDYEASRYNFYSKELAGSYSLKKVIQVFHKDAYKNLNIQNGVEAYKAYMRLEHIDPTDRDQTLYDLLEYCKQDTYSMYEIITGLQPYLNP